MNTAEQASKLLGQKVTCLLGISYIGSLAARRAATLCNHPRDRDRRCVCAAVYGVAGVGVHTPVTLRAPVHHIVQVSEAFHCMKRLSLVGQCNRHVLRWGCQPRLRPLMSRALP